MSIAVVIQARLGSTRLPRKALLPIANVPMIACMVDRLVGHWDSAGVSQQLIVAIPSGDDELRAAIAEVDRERHKKWGLVLPCHLFIHEGSEPDVLGRLYDATRGATTICRLTADCTLLDPHLVDEALGQFSRGGCDYLSASHPARTMPAGFDVEVFSREALACAHFASWDERQREHVTPYFYESKLGALADVLGTAGANHRFRVRTFTPEGGPWRHDENLSIDDEASYRRVKEIFETLYARNPAFTWQDVRDYLKGSP